MIPADAVRKEMNRCGKAHTPFLFIVDYERENGWFVESPLQQKQILFQTNGITNAEPETIPSSAAPEIRYRPLPYEAYARKFRQVRQALLRGDSFLANLTVATPIETELSLSDIFHRSRSPYKLLLPDKFVCFSPESFVRITDRRIATFPMKGTIDATRPDAERTLRNNLKEQYEHNTIVDLLRNDLSQIAEQVGVSRFRYIDRIQTNRGELLQMSSEIAGLLPPDWSERIGDLLFRLLPAGSISGAPKTSTVRILAQAEKEKRGCYTGIFGYYDGQHLDSAVLIRFIEQHRDGLRFRSGGGITARSLCRDEYLETLEKIYLPF